MNVLGPVSETPIRLEAEDAALSGFSVASNGTRIQLPQNGDGTATFDLTTVAPGSYLVRVAHWDENDGVSTIGMSVLAPDGTQDLGSFDLDDDATSSAIADNASLRVKTLPITALIGGGEQLQLTGLANAGERLRIDYIELVPVGDAPVNQVPTLDAPVDDLTVVQDGLLEQSITFTDPEGGTVTYSLSADSPDWLSIDEFGALSGSPDEGDVGVDIPVTVLATDPENAVSSVQFLVTVLDANDAPQLGAALEDQDATVGEVFAYALPVDAFTDADLSNGDALTYTAELANGDPLPAWLAIDATTGTLSGTPDGPSDVQVVVTATDLAGESVSAPAILIDVTEATTPIDPVKIEVENFTGVESAVNFRTNTVASASNDQILRLSANTTGSVTHDLAPYAGASVQVAVTFIDETDGVGAGRVFVDGQLLGSWLFDGTAGEQVTPGGATGNLAQPGNYRTVMLDTSVDISPTSVLTLEIDSEGGEFGRVDFVTLIPTDQPGGNEAPTDVTVIPVAEVLPEDTDTAAPVKVADIIVTDDLLGTNTITLTGADAGSFNVVGTELFLNAGVTLDFESLPSLDVTVQVDDPTVGVGSFDVATDFTLLIGDVNEAPVLTVTPVLTDLSQSVDTSAGVKVADITVVDDALGMGTLAITGDDADLFEIVADETTQALSLNLVAGALLDALDNPSLDVTVELDDPNLGGDALEGSVPVSVTVSEGGTPAGDVILRINAFGDGIIVADGPIWQEDSLENPSQYFNGTQNRGDAGSPNATPGIEDVPDEIFATARSGSSAFSYDIPISDLPGISEGDTVTVNLYFAESPNTRTVTRIFDVEMESALAIDDLNPLVQFGEGNGGVISTVVEVVGDTLNIEFLNNNVQNAIVSGIEIREGGSNPINEGGGIEPPSDPTDVLEVLGLDDGVFDGIVQGQAVDAVNDGGENGSVVLTVIDGVDTVDASNFRADSFQLTNTGDKEVAAVFIDIRDAVFADQVFDNDGTGGDTISKAFLINSDDGTGAFLLGSNGVNGSNDDNLFFEGDTPAADTSGQSNGAPISGGYRGLLLRFDGSEGGFDGGETVGFSGDGDSNSLAGFRASVLNPNNVTSTDFDTGGQSGSELIGSSFTVLFADGTTATGYLGSDTTLAGAAGEAVQGRATKEATLTVDTGDGLFDSGEVGTYGGTLPTVTVVGTPGDTVRVTLHKGFQPTDDGAGGSPDTVAEVIQGRLDALVPDFAVNNAFDVQTFDVTIGANGNAVLPPAAFDYTNTVSGETFAGDDVQPLAFTAAVVAQVSVPSVITGTGASDLVPVGPVSQPIYLTNPTATPVNGEVVEPVEDGYFEIVGTGANQYFKIQMEDGSGGTNPGGKWSFQTAADGNGNQSGFQGDGYYLFGSEDSLGVDKQVNGDELLEYDILVPEGAEGTYTFSFRVAIDGIAAKDRQNDLWLNFKHAEDAGAGEIVNFLSANGSNIAEPDIQGFVKLFGGPNDGDWGTTSSVDGQPKNFKATIDITEAGRYTIQIDGRSEGYHVDSFELYKGENPKANAPGSAFIGDDPGTGGGGTGGGGGGTPTGDAIRIQAEDATALSGNYVVQNISEADEGQVIGVSGGDGKTGGATYDLDAAGVASGTYDVTVGFFDETDGVSSLEVNVGGSTQTITFDDTSGTTIADASSFREVTLTNILVDGGDVLSISAVRDLGEPVRVDYFDFTPTDGGGTTGGGGTGGGNTGGETPDQLVVAVDASADDFEEQGGANSSDLEFGLNGNSPQAVGIRFDDIDIPAGATIAEAFLRFEAFETSSGAATFDIAIENGTNPASYSSANGPGDRAYADEFVWNVEAWVDGQTYETPDISGLINKVVGANGGSDIALAFQIDGSGSRVAHSFNGSGDAPELVIVFDNDTIL